MAVGAVAASVVATAVGDNVAGDVGEPVGLLVGVMALREAEPALHRASKAISKSKIRAREISVS